MLDPKHFKVIAGQSNVEYLTATTQDALDLDKDLTSIQETLYAQGWRGAELIKNFQGWVLHADSGLENFQTLAGSGNAWTYEEALEASKRWFVGDATHRYVFVRKNSLEG